ncbi:polymorphic toxin-type HINT domain-containing protein [Acrocarpospora sp. B8E8]|uniref:polymorphic toxin-type HINT domain-containing protein n=1 Tax=Acrocarpospora sp. B8E8 TaxID=3153572 RepID=UPI00325FC9B6
MISSQGKKILVRIIAETGGSISAIISTENHPFWIQEYAGWFNAADLVPGLHLQSNIGTPVRVREISTQATHVVVHNIAVANDHTYYVAAGHRDVLVHNSTPDECYRGGRPGESPSLAPRPNDYKVDPKTGFVKESHGVSVFDNPESVAGKGFVPHSIDMRSVPSSLRIIQRGRDPRHFEIVPAAGANLTPRQYAAALAQIKFK